MDNYPGQHYDTKIESFDTCIIESSTQQQEMTQPVDGQVIGQQTPSQVDVSEHESSVTIGQSANQNQVHLNSNVQTNLTLTPVRLPAILDGEFFQVVRVEDTNVTVRCLQCQKLLNGNLKSTGNFLSHIKRVHPFMIDRIKSKTNQRRPAIIYLDSSTDKTPELVKPKHIYKKYYKMINDDCQLNTEENFEQSMEWPESPSTRKRRTEDEEKYNNEVYKSVHNNSMEDEFDAIGRNVAAKLRNMRLDQRIIAEKLLNDILFEAQLGNLHRESSIHV